MTDLGSEMRNLRCFWQVTDTDVEVFAIRAGHAEVANTMSSCMEAAENDNVKIAACKTTNVRAAIASTQGLESGGVDDSMVEEFLAAAARASLHTEMKTCVAAGSTAEACTYHACIMHVPCTYHACTMHVPSMYHACTMHVPCTYHAHTMHVPCTYHARTMHVPCMYHACTMHVPCMYHACTMPYHARTMHVPCTYHCGGMPCHHIT